MFTLRNLCAPYAIALAFSGPGTIASAVSPLPATSIAAGNVIATKQLDALAHHYIVYYWCHGWQRYGCYDCIYEAQSAAHRLQHQGYSVTIQCG